MRKNLTSFLGILLFLLLCIPLTASVYYVDNRTGDDNHDGLSPDKPFKTLAAAASRLAPGDDLHLAAGCTFHESLIFKSSGTPDKPITVHGNGAVISGLEPVPADKWQHQENGLYLNPNNIYIGARRPRVLDETHRMISISSKDYNDLKPGEALWNESGIFYRAVDGISPASRQLYGFYRDSGLVYQNNSYIIVENVISENNANDGFNVHGYCRGLVFRNITGRWNGDDGFSIHEDVQALVMGAHLHHNDFGIQDICLSRSQFFGVLAEDNRIIGVDLVGGFRSMDDCLVRNNATAQIRVITGGATHMGIERSSHTMDGQAYFRNVLVTGGAGPALVVEGRARVTTLNCSFLETGEGIVFKGAELGLQSCVIANSKTFELNVKGNGKIISKGNDFFPGRFSVNGQVLSGRDGLAAIHDSTSACLQPAFRETYHAAQPRVIVGNQYSAPGFNSNVPLGFLPETPETYALQNVPASFNFDFETINPWSRTFCDPDKKGVVKHSSTLSTEQAVSGKSSAKVTYVFPPSPKGQTIYCKLFTVPFNDLPRPITYWKFKIYSENTTDEYKTRLRDHTGEYFYGPSGKFDWSGWKTFEWNLADRAPAPITGGDGNHTQNPPMELVIDFYVHVPPEGRTFTFYIDDLEFH